MNNGLDWLTRKSSVGPIAALCVMLVLLGISGLTRLDMESDYRIFFEESNPELLTYERFQSQYQSSENVLLVLVPRSPQGHVLSEQGWQLQQWLTAQSWQLPFVTRVDSLPDYPRTQVDGDDLFVEELLSPSQKVTEVNLKQINQYATSEIQLLNQLIDQKGQFAGLNLTVRFLGVDTKGETQQLAAAVREMIALAEETWPDFEIYSSGMVMLNNAFFEAAQGDFKTLIPIMLLGISVIASLLLRSWLALACLNGVMLLSIAAALGTSAYLGMALSAPTVSVPIILATIVIASGVHLFSALNSAAGNTVERLKYALNKTVKPITLTNMTTILGFLSMNFSESPPFRDLGNMVAIGVFACWLLTLTLVPFIWLCFSKQNTQVRSQPVIPGLDGLSRVVYRTRRRILMVGLPLCLVVSGYALNNVPNDNFVEYFDESVQFRQQTDFINQNLTGIYSLEFSAETQQSNGVLQPKLLLVLDDFTQWLRKQPEVTSAVSITEVLKDINQNMHAGDDAFYRLPTSQEEAAQYFLLYEMSLPSGHSLSDRVNMNKSSARITARLTNLDSIGMKRFEQRALEYWHGAAQGLEVKLLHSSPTLMFSHIGVTNTNSLILGALVALVMVSILLAIAFRSVPLGLFSMIPNLLPVTLAFGIWGMLVGEVSMGLAGVSSMVIGIVVDDTVHFLHHYRHHRQRYDVEEAIRRTISIVGPAMIVSSLVLIAGFMTLTLSSFEKNAAMGLLTSITIGLAVLADLILLPAMLAVTDKYWHKKPVTDEKIQGVGYES
ncbi:hypothetical protein BS333_03980 [Vibrio azureus]|uniref:SSD domain-containing protein n=1 Tax=Vibrio azureus NBRC 104587 TaxID=1219077 RepID=U3AVZ1_9VIBR|nr:MMPL family transporter [Vibrio azureus]AUI85593.1 hypothetical protein BS333_03980 [Vibrio azureus]GAD77397.1 hypothetical protein VAZ01S_073_00300 [Vibrio azureus NBRC 104587]